MRRRDDPTPPAVSFPSPFPSRTAPSHSERRTRACGEGPKRGEKGATRVENGGPVVTENPTEGNWTVSRLSTSRSLRLFISLHSLPSFLGTEWRGWEASVTRRTDDERSERGWSERVSDKRRVTTEDPYDPASVGSCLTAQPGLPHGLSSSAHTVPIPFTLAALNLTSRKGSFMKVSIILGDRRERSEQREPRMGGNRSERSRVSSGVVDSRPFLRHVRFISLSILLHSTLSGRRPPVASLRGWSRVMNVVNEPDDRRRVTRPAPNPPHLVTHAANPTHPVPRYALSLPPRLLTSSTLHTVGTRNEVRSRGTRGRTEWRVTDGWTVRERAQRWVDRSLVPSLRVTHSFSISPHLTRRRRERSGTRSATRDEQRTEGP